MVAGFDRSTAVLLANTGTPDAPTTPAVQEYLARFLSDRRIVNLPPAVWKPILHGIVLRARPRKTVQIYKSIWTDDGSPYTLVSERLEAQMAAALGAQGLDPSLVRMAHRYGNPSIGSALAYFKQRGVERLVVLPLYPQQAYAPTGAVHDELQRQLRLLDFTPKLAFIDHYHLHPAYIQAMATQIAGHLHPGNNPVLIYSFHSIPLKDQRNGDPYPQQTLETAQAISSLLSLVVTLWHIAYQSRFDDAQRWLAPFLVDTIERLLAQGVTNLNIVCPGFAVDCTETLYDINIKTRAAFLKMVAKAGLPQDACTLTYIPALNDVTEHIEALTAIILAALGSAATQGEHLAVQEMEDGVGLRWC